MTEAAMFQKQLPVGSIGHRASGWWGMLALIGTEAALFAYLLFSYFYLATQSQNTWLPTATPSLYLALPNTIILIVSSLILWCGERAMRRGQRLRLLLAIGLALVLGVAFMAIQVQEWHTKTFSITDNAYGSLYFTITGFHMLHVLGGELMLAVIFIWTALGHFDAERHAPIAIGAISVFKAVYLDKRELKCACVGGSSNVPLGFVSLTENLMMMGMGIWMLIK